MLSRRHRIAYQLRKLAALVMGTALFLALAPVSAQTVLLRDYANSLPKPKQRYPEYIAPKSLPSAMEVFWEGVKMKESNANHWRPDGLPIPGGADKNSSGQLIVISIGISQVVFTNGAGAQKARSVGMAWDFDQYLYNPIYNEKLGRLFFTQKLRNRNNNPCAAFADYNWGDGNTNKWIAGSFSTKGTPWQYDKQDKWRSARLNYIEKSSAYALKMAAKYGYSEQVAHILQTSPGCTDKMVDVDPQILKPATDGPYTGPPIEGYCAPQAAQMLRGTYEYRQKDLDETFEPLFRQIKTGGTGLAKAQEGGGSSSPGSSSSGSSSSGSSSGSGGTQPYSMEEGYDQLSSCVGSAWPNISIQYPTMDQIIRGVAQELTRRACSEAREIMSEQRNKLTGSFWLNTRIPGVPNAGVVTTGSGGDKPPGTP